MLAIHVVNTFIEMGVFKDIPNLYSLVHHRIHLSMKYLGRLIIWLFNLLSVGFLTFQTFSIDNDKSSLVFLFGYLIILSINLVSWGILSLLGTKLAEHMGKVVLMLSVLFVPILVYMLNII